MQPTLHFLPASKLATMLRAGEITSRQTVEACVAQIKKHNSTDNAIVTLNETEALAQADQADQAMRDGKPCAPRTTRIRVSSSNQREHGQRWATRSLDSQPIDENSRTATQCALGSARRDARWGELLGHAEQEGTGKSPLDQ
jgi:hypothetical protein